MDLIQGLAELLLMRRHLEDFHLRGQLNLPIFVMMSEGDKMGFDVIKCTRGPQKWQTNKGSSWEQKFAHSLSHIASLSSHHHCLYILQNGLKHRPKVVQFYLNRGKNPTSMLTKPVLASCCGSKRKGQIMSSFFNSWGCGIMRKQPIIGWYKFKQMILGRRVNLLSIN